MIGTDTHTRAVQMLQAQGKRTWTAAEYVAAATEAGYEDDSGVSNRVVCAREQAEATQAKADEIDAHRVLSVRAGEIIAGDGQMSTAAGVDAVLLRARAELVDEHDRLKTARIESAEAAWQASMRVTNALQQAPERAQLAARGRLSAAGNTAPSDADVLTEIVEDIGRRRNRARAAA